MMVISLEFELCLLSRYIEIRKDTREVHRTISIKNSQKYEVISAVAMR